MSTNQPEHETQTVLELPLDTAQLSEQFSDVKESDRSLDALKAMSQVLPNDTGFHLITLMLMQQTHSLKAEQLHYFRGPIIFGKTPWSDALPQDAIQKLMNAVRLERYWLILEELKSEGSPLKLSVRSNPTPWSGHWTIAIPSFTPGPFSRCSCSIQVSSVRGELTCSMKCRELSDNDSLTLTLTLSLVLPFAAA